MKRNILILVMILSVGLVNAIDLTVDNYYPVPVEAGDYVNVWLKVSNKGSSDAEDTSLRIKQDYPFSLDPGEDGEIVIKKIEQGSFTLQKIKIRVDAGAKEGDNKITFQYKDCKNCEWKEKGIYIIVVESQTTFDVVLQELNAEGVFIAVANIGKNPANAVTVSIPEQENFKTELVSASIIGNLESGDYTLVGFKIIPKSEQSQKDLSGKEKTNAESSRDELLVQVHYTDPLGIRRKILKTITLNPVSLNKFSSRNEMMSGKSN